MQRSRLISRSSGSLFQRRPACEHNVARLVTGGLGRRFLATSPAGDQAPAFGVLQATEAKSHLPDFDLLLDVREPDEWAAGVIGTPKTITLGRVMRDVATDELQSLKGKKLLVYCRSGARSALACGVLAKNGFQVTNLAGGFRGWREANSSSSDAPPNKA